MSNFQKLTSGKPVGTQVQGTDIGSGAATSVQFLAANGSGSAAFRSLASGDLPTITLTSDVTGSSASGSIATTVAKIQGTTVSGTTGTTNVVFSGSPTIVTPTITTNATIPLVIGGTTASSTLTLESTSGAGTTDSIIFKTGSQTTALTIDHTQIATFTGPITSTLTGSSTSAIFANTAAGTGAKYIQLANTSGSSVFAVENSVGNNLMTGSSAYATVIYSAVSKNLEFGTNSIKALTIDTSQRVDIIGAIASPGTVQLSDSATNSTTKQASMAVRNYTNANNPGAVFYMSNGVSTNDLRFGGGVSTLAAATSIGFYTASGINTATGTLALTIDSSQNATFSNQIASGAINANSLITAGGGTNPLTGTTQRGFLTVLSSTTAATTSIIGFQESLAQAAGITTANSVGFLASGITLGSGSTLTRHVDLLSQGSANHIATNNAALSDNQAFTGNFFINQSGTDTSVLTGTLTAAGGVTITGGSATAGGIYKSAGGGLDIQGITGSTNDVSLRTPSNLPIFGVPTGTQNVSFTASILAGSLSTPANSQDLLTLAGPGNTAINTARTANIIYTGATSNWASINFTDNSTFNAQIGATGGSNTAGTRLLGFSCNTGTPQMVIDGTGQVGINTSSPIGRFNVNQTADTTSGIPATYGIVINDQSTSSASLAFGADATNSYIDSFSSKPLHINDSGNNCLINASTGGNVTIGSSTANVTHAIRNSSTGNTVVTIRNFNTTTSSDAVVAANLIKGSTTNTAGTNKFIQFDINAGGTGSGFISSNGANAVAFFASSDARLKTNIEPLAGGLELICQLSPVTYNWKSDNSSATGFIAQDFANVLPQMVHKTDDGSGSDLPDGIEAWSMTESGMIPYLVKAIQELKAEFDAYKASHP